jgi:hypothetical protein
MGLTTAPFLALEMKSHYTYFGPFIQQSGGLRCTEERVSQLQLPVAQPPSLNLIFRLLRAAFRQRLKGTPKYCNSSNIRLGHIMNTQVTYNDQMSQWPILWCNKISHLHPIRITIVETLAYKPEGRGFNSRWGNWYFSWTYPSGCTTDLG